MSMPRCDVSIGLNFIFILLDFRSRNETALPELISAIKRPFPDSILVLGLTCKSLLVLSLPNV